MLCWYSACTIWVFITVHFINYTLHAEEFIKQLCAADPLRRICSLEDVDMLLLLDSPHECKISFMTRELNMNATDPISNPS